MKVRDVIKLVEADGWFLRRIAGSHRQFEHPTKKGKLDETEINIREAITAHLELMREDGDPIPKPTTFAKVVEIPLAVA